MSAEDPEVAGQIRLPKKATKVRNKAPAPVQITAEQMIREAKERDLEKVSNAPSQKISDPGELREFQLRKRKEFEDGLRRNRSVMANWTKYAKWEESQSELQRARSIMERALDVDHRCIPLWLQYAEMEMRNRQVNHARNIWDRAVLLMPRINQFWLKYTYMEELLGNIAAGRQVFERWMEWEPEEQYWMTYINFELRYKEFNRARKIYQRFLHCHPEVKHWIKYAKFEEKFGTFVAARQVYEQAVEYFGEDHADAQLLLGFAKFEEAQKEHERARVIYKYALDNLPKEKSQEIFKWYSIHEKKYGERVGMENVIVSKRKHQYEQLVEKDSYNYDAWFDYLRLLETEIPDETDQLRDTYERAIANVPLEQEKRFWRRYIYLWINYALYEELIAQDLDRTREVYKACLDIIPHKKFTFAKVWVLYAKFELRQKGVQTFRRIMGTAIGKCPKDKLFREYIDLQLQLREFDRCRSLYEKFLEFSPENCTTWIKYAEMEDLLGDDERSRAIYELAIRQPQLDMPEILWKSYIDFEIALTEFDNARQLFSRLLKKTLHVKVWLAFAKFELDTEESDSLKRSRQVYSMAHKAMKDREEKEERIMLLEAWKIFETEHGNAETIAEVENEMPKRVKKRRKIETEDGSEAGWEEYYDYIFPSDEAAQSNLKLLELAKKWKKNKVVVPTGETVMEEVLPEAEVTEGSPMEQERSDTPPEKVREGDSDTDISDSSDDENEGASQPKRKRTGSDGDDSSG